MDLIVTTMFWLGVGFCVYCYRYCSIMCNEYSEAYHGRRIHESSNFSLGEEGKPMPHDMNALMWYDI